MTGRKSFARSGWEDFDRTANFLPSSRFLVRAMLAAAPLEQARCVVELGPGTGVITRALLSAMAPRASLLSVECDEAMHELLARTARDERHRPVLGDASCLVSIAERAGVMGEVDAVFSSLALSLLSPPVRDQIYRAAGLVLRPGGVVVQYAYVHARYAVYSPTRGWSRFHTRRYLEGRFGCVQRALVALNIPPAWVYRCARPRRSAD